MARLVWLALIATAVACGTTDDNRPLDGQYVTEAVLAPTCGTAECHSTFTQAGSTKLGVGEVFDTLKGMRASITNKKYPLVSLDSDQFDPGAPERSVLIAWLTKTDPFQQGIGRMPRDAPMPNEDIHYLENWIRGPVQRQDQGTQCSASQPCGAGATCEIPVGNVFGTCVIIKYLAPLKGAQCNPKNYGGLACIGKNLYQCGADFNVTPDLDHPLMACPNACALGVCS